VQLPNLALQPLTLLAAWRAGLTVAMLPMLWHGYEIGKVCELLEPKALIGVSTFNAAKPAEDLCRIAGPHIFFRFVLAFGQDLPDGVASLDEAILARPGVTPLPPRPRQGPALITFTARDFTFTARDFHPSAGEAFIPVYRGEEELLAQGAMTVLALPLDSRDVILNPYPLTGPAGLDLALAPWLISGAVLAQHQPFDYAVFMEQMLASGGTVTALPSPVLEELAKDRVLQERRCSLRRVGPVRTTFEHMLAHASAIARDGCSALRSLSARRSCQHRLLRRETKLAHSPLPLGPVSQRGWR
jgi:mycobactin salicyl-AMP ligase